jgi:hypothetical protein
MIRRCTVELSDGRQCRAAPLREGTLCFLHDPDRAEDAAEARRLGGLRRRREGTVGVVYDLMPLDRVEGIRRILDIVVADGLGLDNGIGRLRVLIAAASTALKALEVGEFEARLEALELVHSARARRKGQPELEPDLLGPHEP